MLWDVIEDVWGMTPRVWSGPGTRRWAGMSRAFPAVNVFGNDDKLAITSEIPGLKIDDLEISVHGRSLTLTGKRELPELGEDESYFVRERRFGEFSRTLTLPYEVDEEKVAADYDSGVLTLHLPRTERDKPRKIEVKTL